jgi:pyruvate dehydrogenase E2 component (dihydrolipoamide acetyltransferase)
MAHDIVMPNAGFDSQEGRLLEWLKQPGDRVQKGEAIALIESDKANVELESIAAGIVVELLCEPEQEVKVGTVIARVGTQDEYQQSRIYAPAPPANTTSASVANGTASPSPVAARMAQANAIDVQSVSGSGPRGRVMRQDVEQHLAQQSGEMPLLQALPKVRRAVREAGLTLESIYQQTRRNPIQMQDVEAFVAPSTISVSEPIVVPEAEVVPVIAHPVSPVEAMAAAPVHSETPLPAGAREIPLTRMRQAIARQLTQSMQQAPHFYVSGEFDVENIMLALKKLPSPAPKINDVLQYLVVQTLLTVPALNATFQDGHLFQHDGVHLAVAVALGDGLITPVLRDAQNYSLVGLAAQSRALIARARENRLQAGDLNGGTFTISNLGVIPQVDHFTAVINPPQVAILAVGTVKQRPIVREGGLFVRHTVHFTLSGDHRVVDGMDLGRFMANFQEQTDHFVHA